MDPVRPMHADADRGPGSEMELYSRARSYLEEGLIRTSVPEQPPPRSRRQWMQWFLPRLHHPQRAFEAIHVAGTSGKGSVAVMVAQMLRAGGVRCGLHVSPYLQVLTEKLWVDGRYASAEQLADLVGWIRLLAEACREPHLPLHGMASVGVFLEHFRREGVQLGVVEAGVGGREDLTNVLRTKVAVVCALGLDHTKTLGPTLDEIAWHKAGIIRPGCRAVVLEGPAERACLAEARAAGAPLRIVSRDSFTAGSGPRAEVLLSFRGKRLELEHVPLAMAGPFQAENAALAVAALEEWDPEGRWIDERAVRAGLAQARLPGRLERLDPPLSHPCPVILDGAHNPDKLAALMAALAQLGRRRLHVVYGALASRQPDAALCRLASLSATFVATEPRVYAKDPRPAQEVLQALAGQARARLYLEPDPQAAVAVALDAAGPEDLVLVTGSLYLVGEARGLWYPEDRILAERRSWF